MAEVAAPAPASAPAPAAAVQNPSNKVNSLSDIGSLFPNNTSGQESVPAQSPAPAPAPESLFPLPEEAVNKLSTDLKEKSSKYGNDVVKILTALQKSELALSKRLSEAKDEDLMTYHKAISRAKNIPMSPDGYDFNGLQADENGNYKTATGEHPTNEIGHPNILSHEFTEEFKKACYGLGIDSKTAKDLFHFLNYNNLATLEAQENYRAEAEKRSNEILQKEWGADFEENMGYAKRMVNDILPKFNINIDEFNAEMNGNGMTHELIKFMTHLGRMFSSSPRKTVDSLSPVDAGYELNRSMGDAEFKDAITNPRHPKHNEAIQKLKVLESRRLANN